MGFTMGEKIRRASFTALLAATLLAGGVARADDRVAVMPPNIDVYTEDWTPQQAAEWHAADEKMEAISKSNMPRQEKCQAWWAIEWPLAKAGNLEMRYSVFISFVMKLSYIPGRANDYFSRIRDGVTLYFHSMGAPSFGGKPYSLYSNSLQHVFDSPELFTAFADRHPPAVRNCLLAGARQECAKIAVKEGIIPSFEDFAAEIDQSLKNGATVRCPE